jgi:prefoldin subunit 5
MDEEAFKVLQKSIDKLKQTQYLILKKVVSMSNDMEKVKQIDNLTNQIDLLKEHIESLHQEIENIKIEITKIKSELDELRQLTDIEEIRKIKTFMEAINPTQIPTIDMVKEMIEEALKKNP